MHCFPLQLVDHLKKELYSIYWLFGSDYFLKEESTRLIQKAIYKKEKDAIEHFAFTVDNKSLWERITHTVQSVSLFSSKKLITLRLIGKQSDLTPLLNLFNLSKAQDTYFVIQAEQNEPAYVKTQGIAIPHWPLSPSLFKKWIVQRTEEKGLYLTEEALHLLIQQTEGNCLAAAQEIDRLYLEYDLPSSQTPVKVIKLIQQSQFNVFDLIRAIEARQTARIVKIIGHLKESKTALPLILWALGQVLEKSGWEGPPHLDALTRLASLDKQIKSGESLVWQNIIETSLIFSGSSCLNKI